MQLDPQQQAAVESASENVYVIAGPGAGKTRVIIERVAYLINERHVSPFEICLVTFTRKAAQEIKKRLVERIGNSAHHVTIGTFHALGLNLLHRFGDIIGFRGKHSTVYGEFEEQYLLKETAIDMGIYNGKTWKIKKRDIDAVFARYYQEGIEPDSIDPVYGLFKGFMGRCKENNSYTYGSILTGLKLLLPSIHQYLKWKHLILDEGQDTDTLQFELLETIRSYCGTSLFIVFDVDQSIYSWRGAVPEYLLEHQSLFDVYRLEANYRSVPEIVEAANRLISHNVSRFEKNMVAVRETAEENHISVMKDYDSEKIADYILFRNDLIKRGLAFDNKLVILSRKRALLRKLSELLTEREIPHTIVGEKTALTNSEEFRRFHAFLKLVVNPYDNFAFLLIRDLIGLSREEYGVIRLRAVQERKSHFQEWIASFDPSDWNIFQELEQIEANKVIENLVLFFEWPFDVSEICHFTSDVARSMSLPDYLDWLATYDIQDEIEESEDTLQLMTMTIHGAKGLEWPNVLIVGCNEGILPSSQAIRNDDLEAERRLMYVAMTRAQDNLIITIRPDPEGKAPVSRFVGEAGL